MHQHLILIQLRTQPKLYNKHLNVNLKAPYFLSQGFSKYLGSRNGLIINIIDQRVKILLLTLHHTLLVKPHCIL